MVDFLCVEASLIVELDGGRHDVGRDAPRTRFLTEWGYRVIRFWNNDVVDDPEGVRTLIRDVVRDDIGRKKKTVAKPSPAKAGEG